MKLKNEKRRKLLYLRGKKIRTQVKKVKNPNSNKKEKKIKLIILTNKK